MTWKTSLRQTHSVRRNPGPSRRCGVPRSRFAKWGDNSNTYAAITSLNSYLRYDQLSFFVPLNRATQPILKIHKNLIPQMFLCQGDIGQRMLDISATLSGVVDVALVAGEFL